MRKLFPFLSILVGLVLVFSSVMSVGATKDHQYYYWHHEDQGKHDESWNKCINEDALHGHDDHSGDYAISGPYDNKDCEPDPEPVYGCTNPEATNYNEAATVDDGSCEFPPDDVLGCTNPEATNYNEAATVDDGSCNVPEEPVVTPVPTNNPRSCREVYAELSSRNNPNIWTSDSALPVWFARNCPYFKPNAPVSGGGSSNSVALMLTGLGLLVIGGGSLLLSGKKIQQ